MKITIQTNGNQFTLLMEENGVSAPEVFGTAEHLLAAVAAALDVPTQTPDEALDRVLGYDEATLDVCDSLSDDEVLHAAAHARQTIDQLVHCRTYATVIGILAGAAVALDATYLCDAQTVLRHNQHIDRVARILHQALIFENQMAPPPKDTDTHLN